VRGPLTGYLASFIGQYDDGTALRGRSAEVRRVVAEERQALVDFAFERYFQTSALIGAPGKCAALIDRLARAGADEIACLVDFGMPADEVLRSLTLLDELRRRYAATADVGVALEPGPVNVGG
jgi:alkanesulfonate monooxygenase SsuD/methylene tetrahydromethanopterin reductase-like flavin-dependent oxidoreductase (luciferase family)